MTKLGTLTKLGALPYSIIFRNFDAINIKLFVRNIDANIKLFVRNIDANIKLFVRNTDAYI